MDNIIGKLSEELHRPEEQISNVIKLIDEGNTIPFIARYRKELHGAMDDTMLRTLDERLKYLRNLAQRRTEILKSIEAQGKLTEELASSLDSAVTLSALEDIYRPFRPKRRTRASIAKEKRTGTSRSAALFPGGHLTVSGGSRCGIRGCGKRS